MIEAEQCSYLMLFSARQFCSVCVCMSIHMYYNFFACDDELLVMLIVQLCYLSCRHTVVSSS